MGLGFRGDGVRNEDPIGFAIVIELKYQASAKRMCARICVSSPSLTTCRILRVDAIA
jgi:hypothetical protein